MAGTVDYLLQHGISGLSLRPLAKALGTSDRMVLYHFGSKDHLVNEAVAAIVDRLTSDLGTALGAEAAVSPEKFVKAIWRVFAGQEQRQAISLLFEIDALAIRHGSPYAETAQALNAVWMNLITGALESFGHDRSAIKRLSPSIAAELLGLVLTALTTDGSAPNATLKMVASRMAVTRS